ncbi:MAG: MFS transporter [Telmatospirillum sp.]|nr:MFS transporter [Telmatospirillum sp.]
MTISSTVGLDSRLANPPSEEVISLLFKKVLPIIILGYIMNFIDRTNISMVKSDLQINLGIDAAAYGLGSGLFFVSYAFFQVPSNLIMHRIGARRTLGVLMAAWGLLSMGTAIIRNANDFYVMRLLLGLVESGFYPGVLYYLTRFFPHAQRARANAIFLMGAAIANIIGNPLAGLLVGMDGLAGLPGWKWLFLMEGLPSILLALAIFKLLPDRPTMAKWLPADAARALEAFIEQEDRAGSAFAGNSGWRDAMRDPQIFLSAATLFTVVVGTYGLGYFLPTIIKSYSASLTTVQVGLIAAIPYVFGGLSLWLVPRFVKPERTKAWMMGLIALVTVGLVTALVSEARLAGAVAPVVSVFGYCIAYAGTQTSQPLIVSNLSSRLSGAALAGGLAIVNMLGQLGGFVGPYIVGFVEGKTGVPSSGLWGVAVITTLGVLLAASMKVRIVVKTDGTSKPA